MDRIRTLDGWRGIAIALVLFDHIQYALLGHFMRPWTQTGHHGVTIFFVLSGFLITSKLLEGPIDLRRFYVRRFFRLMPVAWTYIAVLLLIGHQVHMSIAAPRAVLASLLFYRNYLLVDGGASTWHFWSLSLEEQFYLVWPCILLAAGIRRCRWIAAAGAIGCAVYRWHSWSYYDREFFNCQSQVRADELLVGCLMALLLQEPRLKAAASRWSRMWVLPAFAALVYCMARFTLLPPLTEVHLHRGTDCIFHASSGIYTRSAPDIAGTVAAWYCFLQYLRLAGNFHAAGPWIRHNGRVASIHRDASLRLGKLRIHRATIHAPRTSAHPWTRKANSGRREANGAITKAP